MSNPYYITMNIENLEYKETVNEIIRDARLYSVEDTFYSVLAKYKDRAADASSAWYDGIAGMCRSIWLSTSYAYAWQEGNKAREYIIEEVQADPELDEKYS